MRASTTNSTAPLRKARGQNWTIDWSIASARGDIRLNNAANSIAALRASGGSIILGAAGADGGANLIFNGGQFNWIGDRFTTPVTNNINFSAAGAIAGVVKLTGNINPSRAAINFGIKLQFDVGAFGASVIRGNQRNRRRWRHSLGQQHGESFSGPG